MGLFFNSHSSKNSSSENSNVQEDKYNDALNYFRKQQVKCSSPADYKAIIRLHEALQSKNYDTSDDTSLKEAISSLDANIYHLCRSIIYQNFMLMRKVDELSAKVDRLERND